MGTHLETYFFKMKILTVSIFMVTLCCTCTFGSGAREAVAKDHLVKIKSHVKEALKGSKDKNRILRNVEKVWKAEIRKNPENKTAEGELRYWLKVLAIIKPSSTAKTLLHLDPATREIAELLRRLDKLQLPRKSDGECGT